MKNVFYYNMLIDAMNSYDDAVAIADENGEYRYSELLSGVDAFAERLTEMGVRKGDHVGLWSFNCCNFLRAHFAIAKIGAAAILLNASLPADDIAALMKSTDTIWLLYGETNTLEKNPNCLNFIMPDASHRLDINSVDCPHKTEFAPLDLPEEESKKLSYMIFTSGSSGAPKAVMSSQRANISTAECFTQQFPKIHGAAICLAVPMFHCLGLHVALSHLFAGGMLCLCKRFDTASLMSVMEKHPVENMAAILTVYLRLIEAEGFDKYAPRMNMMFAGGGAINAAQIARIKNVCPNSVLLNGYGQTEAGGGITFVLPEDSYEKQIKTVGRPNPDKYVAIMDVRGNLLPNNKIGEIVVKDDGNLMLGYYNYDKSPIDENGWLHTADLGYIDDDGFVVLSGRIKDIIIKGGENITPSEIERELSQMDGVAEVKIMGAPDAMYGESIQACITPQSGYTLDAEAIQEFMKGRVSNFKMPSNFFVFDNFPLQANGKVNFGQLKIEMLQRLGLINAAEELEKGIVVLSLTAISRPYVVAPIRDAVVSLADSIGFSKHKQFQIALCVEEILLDWLSFNYEKLVQMFVELRLQQDCMQLCVSDMGAPFRKGDDGDTTAGQKIVLSFVDRFTMAEYKSHNAYNFDFLYEDGMKVDDFVYHSNSKKPE